MQDDYQNMIKDYYENKDKSNSKNETFWNWVEYIIYAIIVVAIYIVTYNFALAYTNVIDQEQLLSSGAGTGLAQSFISTGGNISRIDLLTSSEGTAFLDFKLCMGTLIDDWASYFDAGNLNGYCKSGDTLLTQVIFKPIASTSAWTSLEFSEPIITSIVGNYYFVPSYSSGAGDFGYRFKNTDVYPNGFVAGAPTYDLAFKIYYTTDDLTDDVVEIEIPAVYEFEDQFGYDYSDKIATVETQDCLVGGEDCTLCFSYVDTTLGDVVYLIPDVVNPFTFVFISG